LGEKWPTDFACDSNFHVNPGIFNMPQIYDMGRKEGRHPEESDGFSQV
jgi:hypothetical protein